MKKYLFIYFTNHCTLDCCTKVAITIVTTNKDSKLFNTSLYIKDSIFDVLIKYTHKMELKSKVLIVGRTGYLGKRLVKASLEQGHDTYILQRPEIGVDIEKVQMLLSFKKQGARLVAGSFDNHHSLVEALKQIDVVICAISSVHFRSNKILLQLKLIDAIKEAGNIKMFLPSEFDANPAKMVDALEPGRVTYDEKMVVRKAIEDTGIPFTYVSTNCFAGYFVGGLCQLGHLLPSTESVLLLGDGNKKCTLGYGVWEDKTRVVAHVCCVEPRRGHNMAAWSRVVGSARR